MAQAIIELRNDSPAALGDAHLILTAPRGDARLSFVPLPGARDAATPFFELSTDDGASWSSAEAPDGSGAEDNPLTWTQEKAQPLARLGPAGSLDDSVLLRWRAALGDDFGSAFSSEARVGLSASAVDACGSVGKPTSVSGIFRDITSYKSALLEAQQLTQRVVSIQDEERQRIAQDLHDSTAQHLAANILDGQLHGLDLALREIAVDPGEAVHHADLEWHRRLRLSD